MSLSALKNSHLEQLSSEFFALLSTRFSILKIDYLIMRIGIKTVHLSVATKKQAIRLAKKGGNKP
ncbi:hypothetical protein PESP_a3067 [Pseudoalteromonas espejiana DSM 9414]|uniref:Uncharacterized protein n=1 Tax=Pseudoalteromonas espejiana TaxID=28107 RepID=A0A510XST4_9GAMM|nr:hypothetical protein PESP_a3067 [Pseudoalteromonas espejiana DSM 9414]GEK54070.1 hypothetical protein PES01_09150 [Pseudoalteromonas espejiana]